MSPRLRAGVLGIGLLVVAACSTGTPGADPTPAAPSSAVSPATPAPTPAGGTATAPSSQTSTQPTTSAPPSSPAPTITEPTTTNTLPPPPAPSRPAPSTAGKLTALSLPVPAGWKTIVREGGVEEGFQGNGTWVHARDPRYAAQAVVAVGCADVTRDDYPDPTAALEGNYQRKDEAGIGLVLTFATEKKAIAFADVYRQQVAACSTGDGSVSTTIVASDLGLIDHRSGDDGDWTEVVRRSGTRLTLILLGDPGHRISKSQSEALLREIGDS